MVVFLFGLFYLFQDFGFVRFDLNPWAVVFLIVGAWLAHNHQQSDWSPFCGCKTEMSAQSSAAPKTKKATKKSAKKK
jgi:hypothetical protein